jgi:hypothetical protein
MTDSLFVHYFGHCLRLCATGNVRVAGSTCIFRSLYYETVEEVTFTDILKQQIVSGQKDYCFINRHIT